MFDLLKKFKNDESGATAIEYGLIAALISVGIIAGASAIGGNISDRFTDIGTALKDAKPTTTP
ncbi:MAG TPA: Flp family type IVb pilin [Rhizobiaceae bacterium]|nr:Flp family type IVb pilin [Rhizobiaceae bacterium]